MIAAKGGASEPPNIGLPGKAGGVVAVRRTLASTICRIADPTQVPRPRQLRDASRVMSCQPAHQSMITRRFDDRAPCLAWMSPKQALAGKPRIHSPASGIGGHESGACRDFESSQHRHIRGRYYVQYAMQAHIGFEALRGIVRSLRSALFMIFARASEIREAR